MIRLYGMICWGHLREIQPGESDVSQGTPSSHDDSNMTAIEATDNHIVGGEDNGAKLGDVLFGRLCSGRVSHASWSLSRY